MYNSSIPTYSVVHCSKLYRRERWVDTRPKGVVKSDNIQWSSLDYGGVHWMHPGLSDGPSHCSSMNDTVVLRTSVAGGGEGRWSTPEYTGVYWLSQAGCITEIYVRDESYLGRHPKVHMSRSMLNHLALLAFERCGIASLGLSIFGTLNLRHWLRGETQRKHCKSYPECALLADVPSDNLMTIWLKFTRNSADRGSYLQASGHQDIRIGQIRAIVSRRANPKIHLIVQLPGHPDCSIAYVHYST